MTIQTLAATATAFRPPPTERPPLQVTWHSFDLRTGRRGPKLRVAGQSPFGRLIGEPTDANVTVYCYDAETETPGSHQPTEAGTVPGWESATLPGRTMLVALDDLEQPLWAGMVLRRRSDASTKVTLDLATLEAYFDRRYVSDVYFTNTDQAVIVKGLIDATVATGVAFTVDAPLSGKRLDRAFLDDEDKTHLSVLQDLMGAEGGPEFTVDVEWADVDHTTLSMIVRAYDRIGTGSDLPNAVFAMPGSVTEFSYVEDYSAEHGANDVVAVSSGSGDARPTSGHHIAYDLLDAGWAKFEHKFTPSTSIGQMSTLNAHARSELAAMKVGLHELTLQCHLDSGPRVGSDFHLGDDVSAVLTCPRFPSRVGPDGGLVPGYENNVRLIGWQIDLDARRLVPTCVEET